MKEFENWDINNKINYANASGKELCVQEERRKSWRAALEWIEHIVVHESDGPSSPKSLIQCIDEELED